MNFGRLGSRSAQDPISQINVTPLVDVMLVLLVIFILTAPFLGSSLQLDLPRTPAGSPAAQTGPSIVLELDRDERLVLNGQPLALEQLARRLTELAAQGPEVQLQLRADQAVPYGRVVQVLGLANQAGIARIGFMADAQDRTSQR
jgi:biopolymer transport protein TolR